MPVATSLISQEHRAKFAAANEIRHEEMRTKYGQKRTQATLTLAEARAKGFKCDWITVDIAVPRGTGVPPVSQGACNRDQMSGSKGRVTADGRDAHATFLHPEKMVTQLPKRNLPHWRQEDATYAVTFRLADSLPKAVLINYAGEDRKSTRLNSSHLARSRMPSSA